MQDLNWGVIPTQRSKKEEQFTTPVVTMAALTGKGAGRKISFNRAAQELMNIQGEDSIIFAFTMSGQQIYVRKSTSEGSFKLTKTCTFSDKKTFEYITKLLSLDNSVENHFDLSIANVGQEGVFELSPLGHQMYGQREVIEFAKMELGEISDEQSLEADLSSIPATPEGGTMYEIIDETTEESSESLNAMAHAVAEEADEENWD